MAPPPTKQFPEKAFIQEALERNFASWELDHPPSIDLEFTDSATGFTWIIEVKGGAAPDLDREFQGALGQLLVQMSLGPRVIYALAMPDTDAFARRRQEVPRWVREKLNLYWLVVDEAGEVEAIPPHENPV